MKSTFDLGVSVKYTPSNKGYFRPFWVSGQVGDFFYVFGVAEIYNVIKDFPAIKRIFVNEPDGLCISFRFDIFCSGDGVDKLVFEALDKRFPVELCRQRLFS